MLTYLGWDLEIDHVAGHFELLKDHLLNSHAFLLLLLFLCLREGIAIVQDVVDELVGDA